MQLAVQVSKEATCPRAQVGSVLVKDNRVISLGFNGSCRGTETCKEGGCWIQIRDDVQTCARAVHSETNAILNAAYNGVSTKDCVLFCNLNPCLQCLKILINAGIKQVYYLEEYPDKVKNKLLQEGQITCTKIVI